ncbi:MAG TPA: prepilin-type N-terminal cleavage/methylation domain-containing protein, partial [Gammaproteobacteria bacterium]|nr:prepilin-type N-terminal cleavage/methylation domain-containing protein [Gammaproteobacteria bacterium]
MNRPAHIGLNAGFTLLELLLALSLSALLLSVLAYASSTISTQWNRQNDLLQDDVEQALYLLRLERALQGMFPYTYRPEGDTRPSLLIAGSEDALIWVSTLSPGEMGRLNVWRLRNSTEGILLDRAPLAGGFSEETMNWGSMEKVPGFAAIRIRYAAFSDADKSLKWFEEWPSQNEAKTATELPRAVQISFFRQKRVIQEQHA